MPAYKNEKAGTWFCKFYYTDWTGKRQQKKKSGFKTKKEALEWEREFTKKETASCDMTLASLAELYFEDCKSRIKPTTLANKIHVFRTKILPYLGDMPINQITAKEVRLWQNELLSMKPTGQNAYICKQREPDTDNVEPISASNVNEHYSAERYSQTYLRTVNNQLNAILNFAVKYYGLANNPCHLAGKIGKKNAQEMQIWTVEEFESFAEAIKNKELSYVCFNMLFWTGMRQGELLALTIDDFDFEAKTVSISKNYARVNKQDLIMSTKTDGSNRVIPIPQFLLDMVERLADSIYSPNPYERLFPVTKYFLIHEMNRGCKAAGVKRIRVHDLRHSHASFLIEKGFSPVLIAKRLGHENIQTTLGTYSHLYPNKQSEVIDLIEKLHEDKMNIE